MLPLLASLLVVLRLAAQELPKAERVEQPAPRGDHRVAGTAVAIDDAKLAHEEEEGELILWQKRLGRIAVPIVDGKWEAWIDSGDPLIVGVVVLRGRQLRFEQATHEPPLPGRLDLRAEWIDDFVLHVVDATTGDELSGVDVVSMSREQQSQLHPGDFAKEQLVQSGAVSPLRFSRYGRWFVRAPGHGWKKIFFFVSEGASESTLELPLACALAVDLRGLDPARATSLRVERIEGSPSGVTLPPRADGHHELDALPPGKVRVRALLDFDGKPWIGHTITLGETVVELEPSKPARVELEVGPTPAGLHDDGTIDRTGFVTLPDGARRLRATGDGRVVFHPVRKQDDAAPTTSDAESSSVDRFSELRRRLPTGEESHESLRAAIGEGDLAVRVPYGCWLELKSLLLEDESIGWGFRPLRVDTTGEPFEIAVPGVADGSRTMAVRLHVVDAETRSELPGVRMAIRAHGQDRAGFLAQHGRVLHPGAFANGELLVSGATSPFHPPQPRADVQQRGYWVGADSHAWAFVEIAGDATGDVVVELAPACDLAIEVLGEPPPGSVIRVRSRAQGEATIAMLEGALEGLDSFEAGDGSGEVLTRADLQAPLLEQLAALRNEEWKRRPVLLGDAFVERDAVAGSTIALDGVPVGTWVVSCESRELGRDEGSFAVVVVDLVAGRRESVRIDVPPQRIPDVVPMRGTLIVPTEWGVDRVELALHAERVPFLVGRGIVKAEAVDIGRAEGKPGLWRWDFGQVLPGEYELLVGDFGHSQVVELGPEGATDLLVEIPPPADVVVRVVDDATDLPVAVRRISWERDWDDGRTGYASVAIEQDERSSEISFRAPLGPLLLSLSEPPYEWFEELFDVVPGRNVFTVRLWRDSGVDLRLRCGGELIDWRKEWTNVDAHDRDGRPLSMHAWRKSATSLVLTFRKPGRCRLTLPRLPGYRPIDPIDVDVPLGEFAEVTVELVAEK